MLFRSQEELTQIHQFRQHTETFGALIQPVLDGEKLAALVAKIGAQAPGGDLLVQNTHRKLRLVLAQAEMLSQRYQVVVANPPYMGRKTQNGVLKTFALGYFPASAADLFSMFIERGFSLSRPRGVAALVTMQSWMFLDSYSALREDMLRKRFIGSGVHMDNMVMGIAFGTIAFVATNAPSPSAKSQFCRVFNRELKSAGDPEWPPLPSRDRKSTRLNSSHSSVSRMPSSA